MRRIKAKYIVGKQAERISPFDKFCGDGIHNARKAWKRAGSPERIGARDIWKYYLRANSNESFIIRGVFSTMSKSENKRFFKYFPYNNLYSKPYNEYRRLYHDERLKLMNKVFNIK